MARAGTKISLRRAAPLCGIIISMKQPLPKISVENLGPIRKGTVEIKPLTVFVGPNSSGKSYMAAAVYGLLRDASRKGARPSRDSSRPSGIVECRGLDGARAHYLPDGRAGMLRAWELIAPASADAPGCQAGNRKSPAHPLEGVAGDFLRTLRETVFAGKNRRKGDGRAERVHPKLKPALASLERDLLNGTISVSDNPCRDPAIRYETGSLRIPVQKASAMIAELAPLHLWIERVLTPGDVLIIDEPEARLHPENQRRIARVLVRLANAGVKVICATHSSLILHQMSNHILSASASEKKRAELGFTDDDMLKVDDIGGYLFRLCEDGARIEPLEIDDSFGVDEDQFVKVAEEISRETYDLIS